MGIIQKDALRTTILTYFGMLLGYVNKVFLFILLLTPEEMGLINTILMVAILFAQLSNLGTFNATTKFFPFLRNKETNHYGFFSLNLFIVCCGILFFTALFIVFQPLIVEYFQERSALFSQYFLWVVPVGIAIALFRFFDSYLRAHYKNIVSVLANEVIFRLAVTGLLGAYWLEWLNFELLLMFICLMQFVPTILMVFYLIYLKEWKVGLKQIDIPRRFRKIIITYSFFSYLNSLSAVVIMSLDAIMITAMVGLEATAVYTTVVFIIRALQVPYSSILKVSLIFVSQYWKEKSMDKMNELYQNVSSVSIIIGLYAFLGVYASKDEFFSFFPEGFESASAVFFCLMIGRIADMCAGINGSILVTSKKYKYDIIFTGSLIFLIIILNVYLIPIYGVLGAAISTTIAMFGYNIARLLFLWYHYNLQPFRMTQLKTLTLFVLVFLLFEFTIPTFSNPWLGILIKSALVTALFPGVLYLLKLEPELVEYIDKLKKKLLGK